jgi:hypothetical protein
MKTLNNYKILIISTVFISLQFGCKNILEETPYSFLNSEEVLKTQDGAQAYLIGVYERLATASPSQDGSFRRGMLIAANFGTDDFTGKDKFNLIYADFHNYTVTSNTAILESTWVNLYKGINQASAIINALPSSNINSQLKDRYIAEAKFLRGLYYFYLVRYFGGVPLILEETTSLDNVNVPRTSIEAVYKQIIKDFEEAEPNLPNKVTGTEIGRATRGAALGILSKVYLTIASQARYQSIPGFDWVNITDAYTKSSQYGQQVIAMTSNYSLVSDYASIFNTETEHNSEIIFAAEMHGAAGLNEDGSFVVNLFGPGATGNINTSVGGQNHGRPTTTLINKFENNDLRKNVNIAFYTYNGCSKVNSASAFAGKFVKPCGFDGAHFSAPNNIPLLRLSDVMLMVAECEAELNGGVPNALALQLVNTLRNKRFGVNTPTPASNTNFLNFIFDERSRELCYEGQRWFDLVRTKRLVNAVKTVLFRTGSNDGALKITDKNYLYPIPQSEILNNLAIAPEDQNPGY